jgi:hypothetical protein
MNLTPRSRPITSLFKAFIITLASTTLLSLGGCWAGGLSEGGDHVSNDKFVYVSDSYSPKTISLIDTRTKQPIWTGDIPVGQQMVVKFRRGRLAAQGESMPDTMLWGLTRAHGYTVHNLNSIPCPPAAARRIEFSLRPTPEFPTANAGDLIPAPPYGGDMPTPPNRSIGPGSGPSKATTPAAPEAPVAPVAPAAPAAPAPPAPDAPKPPAPSNGNDMKPPVVDLPETPAKDAAKDAGPAPVPIPEPSK